MVLIDAGLKLWRTVAKRITGEPLASWPSGDVRFTCAVCGLVETKTIDDLIAHHGIDGDLKEIVEARKSTCREQHCAISVEDFKIPRHYR